jgi:trehalose-6-phosphate synthase
MAGAAPELSGALQVNPYDKRGMAFALQTALNMPLGERCERHKQMLAAVREHDIHNWYGRFVHDLTGEVMGRSPVDAREDDGDGTGTVTRVTRFAPAHARAAEFRQRK